jgi:hypothetical protein
MSNKKLIQGGRFLLPLFLFAITQTGCFLHYVNTPINNPMLSEKGETKIDAAISTSEYVTSPNINVAYSFLPNLGINYNYSTYKTYDGSVDPSTLPEPNIRGLYNEVMVGYYKKLKHNFLLECYGGFGRGNSTNYYATETLFSPPSPAGYSKITYNRYMVLPAISYHYKNWFSISYGLRVSFVDFRSVERINMLNTSASNDLNRYQNSTIVLFDQGPLVSFGSKNLKFYLQYTDIGEISTIYPILEEFKFTVGLQFRFKASY